MFLRVLACFVALLLASCIDGREEYWFHRDGSGRIEIEYVVPATALTLAGGKDKLLEQLRTHLTVSDGVTLDALAVTAAGDRVRVFVGLRYASREQFTKQLESTASSELPQATKGFAGSVESKWRGLSVDLIRTVAPGAAVPALTYATDSQLRGHRLDYIAHFDDAALASNATELRDGGKTLVWSYPLKDAVRAPLVMTAKLPMQVPVWMYALLAAAPLPWIALRLRRRKRQLHLAH